MLQYTVSNSKYSTMILLPFNSRFPKIAEKETRVLTVLQDSKDLPKGEYTFIEFHCDTKNCDCRRIRICVIKDKKKQVAAISYGWENQRFYTKWLGDPSMAKEFKGPALDPFENHSKEAPALLKCFKTFLKDPVYAERLKNHYYMFKEKRDSSIFSPIINIIKKIGRNELCTCGSGKKYKKCCGE